MVAKSNLSASKSDLKQKCTKFLTPFLVQIAALENGVVYFCLSPLINLERCEILNWSTKLRPNCTYVWLKFLRLSVERIDNLPSGQNDHVDGDEDQYD